MHTTTLTITGMHCSSCKKLIEEVCKEIHGVTDCDVDVAGGTATVTHDGTVTTSQIKQAIESLGSYRVEGAV